MSDNTYEITVTITLQSAFIDRLHQVIGENDIPKEEYAKQVSENISDLISQKFPLFAMDRMKAFAKGELEERKSMAMYAARDEINRILTDLMKPEMEAMEAALKISTARNKAKLQKAVRDALKEHRDNIKQVSSK
jgi:hypothetical protein